jgi:hypothetical protein
MRSTLSCIVFAITVPLACQAQRWELGAIGGYGWNVNPSITSPLGSVEAGFPPRGTIGAVFGENEHRFVGGEIRYLFLFGGPELRSDGVRDGTSGHTNLITYDLLIHIRPGEHRLRPFLAAGAGIKVFSGQNFVAGPAPGVAHLADDTQVEPVISGGGGLKYRITRHFQARVDFRAYFSPLPHDVFRAPEMTSRFHGWLYGLVPTAGLSYVF